MNFLKKALPHLIALIIFASISALFFAPQYDGLALRQGDMVQVSGMGQDIAEHIKLYDEHPQWAGRMFSGMPAYLINMNYEGRWIKQIADYTYFLGQPAAFLFIAMAMFYLMLLMFGVNAWLAIIGGVAYGLSTYFPIIIEAGHITKMMALAWIPGVVGSVYYAYRKKWLLGAALAGIFLSIEISTSHPQITYYFGFAVVAMAINEAIRSWKEKTMPKFLRTSAALLAAVALAVGSNLVQLYYVAQYSSDTIRGKSELALENADNQTSGLNKDYATAWSYGKAETMNLFIPNFMGGSSSGGFDADGQVAQALTKYDARNIATQLPGYFGSQTFTSGPVYIGAVMIFLFVLGLFFLDGRSKWWIAAVSALAIMLAWGHNMMWLSDLFLDYFPLYNKFRTVSMILVIVQWSVPLLGILALQKLISGDYDKARFIKSLKYSLAITGGFALLAALALPSMMDFSSASDTSMGLPDDVITAMHNERASLLSADAWRSFIFVALTAAAVWLFAIRKIKMIPMVAAIAVLVTIDLYQVDRRFIKTEDFRPVRAALAITPTPSDEQILQDKSDYRVANFTVSPFMDATTSYFHRSIGGYHAAKLRRYQDLIDKHLSTQNMAVYDMLNTKYFITQQGVQINPSAAGSAWFVDTVNYVENPDQEIAALGAGFEPKRCAIVDQRFKTELSGLDIQADSTASVILESYKVNHLTYKTTASKAGLVLFSEIYYPKGWTAYIDGTEVPYLRADYVLRAMVVPAGSHTIEWRFEAPDFTALTMTTKASSLILILAAIGAGVATFISRRKDE